MLGRFILELGHAGQFPEQGITGQDPAQFRMVMYMTLNEQQALPGIDAAGQEQCKGFQALLPQFGRLLPYRQGMQVRDKISALVILLQLFPVPYRTDIVAQRKGARRLNTAEDDLFLFRFLYFLFCFFCQNKHSLVHYFVSSCYISSIGCLITSTDSMVLNPSEVNTALNPEMPVAMAGICGRFFRA